MKSYPTQNYKEGIHTIRVTFQQDEYKGHVAFEIGGNCRGLDVLEFDPYIINSDDINTFVENDCSFTVDEDFDSFSFKLTNETGDILDVECYEDDLSDCIVALEIINFKESSEKNK